VRPVLRALILLLIKEGAGLLPARGEGPPAQESPPPPWSGLWSPSTRGGRGVWPDPRPVLRGQGMVRGCLGLSRAPTGEAARERAAEAAGEGSLKDEGEGCREGFCRAVGSSGRDRGQWDPLSGPAAGDNARDAQTHLAGHCVVPAEAAQGWVAEPTAMSAPRFPDTSKSCGVKCWCDQPPPWLLSHDTSRGGTSPSAAWPLPSATASPAPGEATEPAAGASASWAGAPGWG